MVQVVYGSEMKKIPSAFHAGKPGNYAISVYMPTDVQRGKVSVQRFLSVLLLLLLLLLLPLVVPCMCVCVCVWGGGGPFEIQCGWDAC